MKRSLIVRLLPLLCAHLLTDGLAWAAPTLILHHGKVVTVDAKFSIAEAIAITDGKITAVGTDAEILPLKDDKTEVVDLGGKMLMPGLMDSHVHPTEAALLEFDHTIPDMESIQDVLDYTTARAKVTPEDRWIAMSQIFITRLKEQRYPTRAELDQAAPHHAVVFATGPDQMLNTKALQECGITRDFKITDGGPGFVEFDPNTGEPTGLLRGLDRLVKIKGALKRPNEQQTYDRVLALFHDYNSVGLTTICDRAATDAIIARFAKMKEKGDLTLRVRCSHVFSTLGVWHSIEPVIDKIIQDPLCKGDDMLRIIGTKVFLDGGMLTGSAYMSEPWGVSKIYGITDPNYRGTLYIKHDNLVRMVEKVTAAGLQFTAHSVGSGAVHELLDAYEEVNKTHPVRETRACITHSNFMSEEDVKRAVRLGVVEDIQPIWLYLDSRTLLKQFGQERTRWFQPLHSIFEAGGIAGGGSDHMQKVGSFRAVNPYNPFLGMWIATTRSAKWMDTPTHPEEALTREQAIQFYTINNAKILFLEKVTGSLEPGKAADMILLDRDLLTCPLPDMPQTQVLKTWLAGRVVYAKN